DRDVAGLGRERNVGEVEIGLANARPHERAVRSRDHSQLTGNLVGARDRNADGHPAALVRMPADPAVLVPRDVGDPFGYTDRLEQRLDAVLGALAAEFVARTRNPGERQKAIVVE